MNINTQTIYGEYVVNKNPLFFFFATYTILKVGIIVDVNERG